MDSNYDSRPFVWNPADNNEFATRNRINEFLRIDPDLIHPVTGQPGSPRLFFIKKSASWPHGAYHVIRETASQRKVLLDTVNGRPIYGDDREKSISDHAYDSLRYYIAAHLSAPAEIKPALKPNSFKAVQMRIKALKKSGYFDQYGVRI
jgi:hypothetical protein